MLKTLLNNEFKLNIDQINNDGDTPLMLVLKNNNMEFIKAILAEVPDQSIKNNAGDTSQNIANSINKKK